MSFKRSRVRSSSRLSDTDVINYVSSPIGSPWQLKCVKPSGFEQTTSSPILSLASPEKREVDQRIGGFLEQCFYCKNEIYQNMEVYMYSDLHAFCTTACREAQMTLDKGKEMQTGKRKVLD